MWNLLQNPYDSTHLTLGMLLHYLEKLKIQIKNSDNLYIWRFIKLRYFCCIIFYISHFEVQVYYSERYETSQ